MPKYESDPLLPWQKALAKFEASHPGVPESRIVKEMWKLTGVTTLTIQDFYALRGGNGMYRELVTRYTKKGETKALEALKTYKVSNVPKAVENHEWAMDQAKEKEDYRAMAILVQQPLRHLSKQAEAQDRPLIVVNIGKDAASFMKDVEEIQDVECEELPALPPGEELDA